MNYQTPREDIHFLLDHIIDMPALLALEPQAELSMDLIYAVLDEGARFIEQEITSLNKASDLQGARLLDGQVHTTPGFKAAFTEFVQAGWQGLPHTVDQGGQGLPRVVGAVFNENMNAACAAFALCSALTDSVIETLELAGSTEQQHIYLPALLTGQCTGSMNLTEPQAGSDLSAVSSMAVPQDDGSYRLRGEKIFISYGDHDLADNIVHLVLARTPDAPKGVKGLSLFIVPKYLMHDQGDYAKGSLNDVQCASLEHKLGLHGSPTAVMVYGANAGAVDEGAIAYLVGEPHRGLEYMFITMNAARYAIAVQALGVADRALYSAEAYANERLQGAGLDKSLAYPVAIHHHPDVARMLQTMRGLTEGARAAVYYGAWLKDMASLHTEQAQREKYTTMYEFFVPIIKGFTTEIVQEISSLGIQVHGGMGYIEETGVAQYWRDSRVFAIYEGTTAIQANDLIGRKLLRDQGQQALKLIEQIEACHSELAPYPTHSGLQLIARNLKTACDAYRSAVQHILQAQHEQNAQAVYLSSVPFLMLAGVVVSGWLLARSALVCHTGHTDFERKKLSTAVFYAAHILPRASGYSQSIQDNTVVTAYPMY